jgi:hypothetical protein
VDLRLLYVDQHLSAAKIARAYHLEYANPKTGESTILHWLKKFEITRRDRAEHIRKVTKEMVTEWIRRYQNGESLKQIAGDRVDPVSVFNHLHKRGIKLRDKVEAQIKAVTKHKKRPFSGDLCEKAYLIGLARGDLYVTRHGRAIRVKTGTTHPAMAELFISLFGKYGPVYLYPRKDKLAGFEWSLDSDLDSSFDFLVDIPKDIPRWIVNRKAFLRNYLAGFF